MFLLVVSIAGFVFLLVLILFQGEVRKDIFKRRQIRAMDEQEKFRDAELEKSLVQRFVIPAMKGIRSGVSQLARRTSRIQRNEAAKARLEAVEAQIRQAGFKMSAQEYNLFKTSFMLFIMAIGGFVALRLMESNVMLALLSLIAAVFAMIGIPRYFIAARIKGRQMQIQLDMPNVMDLLSVSIEAGLGFDAALNRVVEKLEGPLIEELSQVYKEIKMGRARREALAALAKRNTVKELQMFVSAVIQSEQYGTPIKTVLKAQSQTLREARRARAQEKGMKAPVKMMLPMVVFIFPVVLIIILGPTIITVADQFMN